MTPVNEGHVDGPNLVVETCVVCGGRHIHGAAVLEGGRTSRAPHCGVADEPTEYVIVVSGGTS